MRRCAGWAGMAMLLAGGALAQGAPPAAPPAPVSGTPAAAAPSPPAPQNFEAASSAPPPSTDCGEQAGLYAGPKNLKIWVTRKGAMTRENPLRPITGDEFVILQVVVNGRLASAFGPDFDHLQRGPAPQTLAAEGAKLSWDEKADALPRSIRVVADDGTVVLGPIAFEQCGEAPKAAAPAVGAPKKAPTKRKTDAHREGRPGMPIPSGALPQGALPQGALPQGAIP